MRRDDLNYAVHLKMNKLQIGSSSQIKKNRKSELNRVTYRFTPAVTSASFAPLCSTSRDLCSIALISDSHSRPKPLHAAEDWTRTRVDLALGEPEGWGLPHLSPCVLLGNLEILESKSAFQIIIIPH